MGRTTRGFSRPHPIPPSHTQGSPLCLVQFQKRRWTVRSPCGPPGGCAEVRAGSWGPRAGRATSACTPPTTGRPARSWRRKPSAPLTTACEPCLVAPAQSLGLGPHASGLRGQHHHHLLSSAAASRHRTDVAGAVGAPPCREFSPVAPTSQACPPAEARCALSHSRCRFLCGALSATQRPGTQARESQTVRG